MKSLEEQALEAAEKAYRDHIEGRPMVYAIQAYAAVMSGATNEELIERVARAIALKEGEVQDRPYPGDYANDYWEDYTSHAKAAIEAMSQDARYLAEAKEWLLAGDNLSALEAINEGLKLPHSEMFTPPTSDTNGEGL